MIGKMLLILLGIIIGLIILFVTCAGIYIMFHYLDIVEERIDEYFRIRKILTEREEVEKFKKKL